MVRNSIRRSLRVRTYSLESLETRVMLAADWQNPISAVDVDASGEDPTPVDALLVINELNTPTISNPITGELPSLTNDPPPFLDVDGNGFVSPLDALLVVNALSTGGDEEVVTTGFQMADSVIVGMPASHAEGITHDTMVSDSTNIRPADAAVAGALNGNSVTVWASRGRDGSGFGIVGQRYDDTGEKVGGEFLINETTRGAQQRPAVAIWEDGSFIVTWDSVHLDGSGHGVAARMYDADGQAMTGEFQVNDTSRGSQTRPVVAVQDASDFVRSKMAYIAWQGRGVGDNNGVFWTSVDFGSTNTSGEVLANQTTSGNQSNPSIDTSDAGLLAIAWEGRGVGDRRGIFMDVFSPNGTSLLGETLVNDASNRLQRNPSISIAPRGSLAGDQVVVAWMTNVGEPGTGVRARQYDILPSEGSGGLFDVSAGSVIQVNETTQGPQKNPAVSYLDDSTFLVAWNGRGSGDRRGVFSRQFADDGTPLGNESLVNTTTTATQEKPGVTAASEGYIIAWQGRGSADARGIFARFVDTLAREDNDPPTIDPIADQELTANTTDTVTVTASDPNGDPIVLSAYAAGWVRFAFMDRL